jgi:hypothetical protein
MELQTKTWVAIFILCVLVSIAVAVIALVIYDNTMTPNDQQVNLDRINDYLSRLIVGYSPT